MRTHGWAGETPASDDEAIARIIAAARQRIDQCGKDFSISDVAKDVGVTRPTIYRYFASTEALLFATSIAEAGPFLDHLTDHLKDIHDPIEAVIEGIAHTLERLPHERYLSLLLTPGKASAFSAGVTSDTAMSFGRSLLERFDVDWGSVGITDDNMDGLVEFMLRMFQSLVIDPAVPPQGRAVAFVPATLGGTRNRIGGHRRATRHTIDREATKFADGAAEKRRVASHFELKRSGRGGPLSIPFVLCCLIDQFSHVTWTSGCGQVRSSKARAAHSTRVCASSSDMRPLSIRVMALVRAALRAKLSSVRRPGGKAIQAATQTFGVRLVHSVDRRHNVRIGESSSAASARSFHDCGECARAP